MIAVLSLTVSYWLANRGHTRNVTSDDRALSVTVFLLVQIFAGPCALQSVSYGVFSVFELPATSQPHESEQVSVVPP